MVSGINTAGVTKGKPYTHPSPGSSGGLSSPPWRWCSDVSMHQKQPAAGLARAQCSEPPRPELLIQQVCCGDLCFSLVPK